MLDEMQDMKQAKFEALVEKDWYLEQVKNLKKQLANANKETHKLCEYVSQL